MLRAIRGATTVSMDEPKEIRVAVDELLKEICRRNDLREEQIVCILFSNTSDIHSFYPAKAAREAGFSMSPLFSSLEPDIEGALPFCIRVMLFAETDSSVKHVYLRGAEILRKDLKRFSIALDGPSGSGKSTIAKRLAQSFGILYLDTGAMYRACALKAQKSHISDFTEDAIQPLMDQLNLEIAYQDGMQHTYLDGIDVSEDIRRPEVSMAASRISALACVRKKMVEMQRKIAAEQSCVLDGRDIGSFVLPQAEFKFFMTASVDVRARRRYDELSAKGFKVDFGALRREIEERDHNDATREFSPLRRAEDAEFIDTSSMTIEDVVAYIRRKIQEKV